MSYVVLGAGLLVIAGYLLAGDLMTAGYVLLAIGGGILQVGVIGLGVQTGLQDMADARTAADRNPDRPRPWKR